MDGANRKIELQSPEDLTYLINNVRRGAAEHIHAAFPPVEDDQEEDELRVRIEKIVDEVRFAFFFFFLGTIPHRQNIRLISWPSSCPVVFNGKRAAQNPERGEEDTLPPQKTERANARTQTQYISQTFTFSAPNLSINGFDLDASTFPAVYLSSSSPSDPSSPPKKKIRASSKKQKQSQQQQIIQYEPFDARKRARVEELARQEEDLMREIAALKRKLPGAAAQGYADGFWDGVRRDEEAAAAAVQQHSPREEDDGHDNNDGQENNTAGTNDEARTKKDKKKPLLEGVDGPLARQAEVQRTYAGVVGTLGRLKRDMPATVAKMERARVAGKYVVTER